MKSGVSRFRDPQGSRVRFGFWVRALLLLMLVPAGLVRADPADTSYRLVFADEFNGNTLDTSKWSAASPGWTMPNSASTASTSMVTVGNGAMTLAAARNGTGTTFTS